MLKDLHTESSAELRIYGKNSVLKDPQEESSVGGGSTDGIQCRMKDLWEESGPGGSIGDILQCPEDPLEESSAGGGYVWK